MKKIYILFCLLLSIVFCNCATTGSVKNTVNTNKVSGNKNNDKLRVLQFEGTPYTELPEGTDGSVGTKGRYVLFGDWPQTIKAADIVIDETTVSYMGAHTYYLGSDGAWYYQGKEIVGGTWGNYIYSDGTKPELFGIRYFKVEPIKWRIATSDYNAKKLLVSETLITSVKYYLNNERRMINNEIIYANNYEHSTLRAFLNGLEFEYKESKNSKQILNTEYKDKGFLQTAFTLDMREQITITDVDNSQRSANPYRNEKELADGINMYACNNTNDKIFALSFREVTNPDYGFTADYKIRDITDSRHRDINDYLLLLNVSPSCGWWLRSPYFNRNGYENNSAINSPELSGETTARAVSSKDGYSDQSCPPVNIYGCAIIPALCLE